MTSENKNDKSPREQTNAVEQFYSTPIDDDAKLRIYSRVKKSLPRFEALFHQFWERLPSDAKKVMVPYWLAPEHGMADTGPYILLLYNWPGRQPECGATMQAMQETGEFRILLHRRTFEAMPDEIAIILIAHEFAHVYQFATGTLYSHAPLSREEAIQAFEQKVGEPYEIYEKWCSPEALEAAIDEAAYKFSPVEREADKITLSWGFDMHALDKWNEEWARQFN